MKKRHRLLHRRLIHAPAQRQGDQHPGDGENDGFHTFRFLTPRQCYGDGGGRNQPAVVPGLGDGGLAGEDASGRSMFADERGRTWLSRWRYLYLWHGAPNVGDQIIDLLIAEKGVPLVHRCQLSALSDRDF